MGQAFDEEGGVLGEAFGETKREVFDQLIKKHPDAHEIRIRSILTAKTQEGQIEKIAEDAALRTVVQENITKLANEVVEATKDEKNEKRN